jgi:pimeloyl-ACP methyl ester carboxylesterase
VKRKSVCIIFMAVIVFSLSVHPAKSEFSCEEGLQDSGSIYRICMPVDVDYNGRLVIWAHGFQDAGTPVEIPEDQLSFHGVSIPDIVTSLGFGFATNSYSKTGLAVLQGSEDIQDLVDIYKDVAGEPEKIYLVGASEGGIITALLVEQHPDTFHAGLSLCGPVGYFPFQINYFGDARATFQAFFPNLIPGDPFDPPQELVDNWFEFYENTVKAQVVDPSNRHRLNQWVKVAKLPFDADNYIETVELSVQDVLRYSVINMNDARTTLGGFPFGNIWKWYSGSDNDILLNQMVPRRKADPDALDEMKSKYNTQGLLNHPLITMHTLRDQQVPYLHEVFYNLKTIYQGSFLRKHINIPIDRFGHCEFTQEEALLSFGLMLFYAGDLSVLSGVGSMLEGDALKAFETLALKYKLP